MVFSTRQKYIIGVFLAILLALSFLFRAKITKFLSFDYGNVSEPVVSLPDDSGAATPQSSDKAAVSGGNGENYGTKSPGPLSYSGRDPAEIRPLAEEIRLFNQDQLAQIYSSIKIYADAVKKKPNYFDGWLQIGILKKTIGDWAGARDAWEYLGVISPQNSVSFFNLGDLYWHYLKDFPKAEKNYLISIKNKPQDAAPYISLSDLYSYSYKEKADLADDILMRGLSENPGDVNLMKALAYLYQRENKYAQAVEWWQKVLTAEPQNQDVAATIEALKKKIAH